MMLIKNGKIIDIMQNTLNCVDSRLANHGKRVSYMLFKMLQLQNKLTDQQLRDRCILAILHDIGAYKTEEIDKMVIFETVNVWEHSIYGYLSLKYFSPLSELAPAILFHHADCCELQYLHPSLHELSQMISLCDRADIFSQSASKDIRGFRESVENARDIKFRSDIVDLFFAADIDLLSLDKKPDGDKKFRNILYGSAFTDKEINDYIKMIILSIEFRSRQTVIHTIAAACVAKTLAGLMGLGKNDIANISAGAMLHDIGKTGIPVEILENPSRLNEAEMKIMKSHVSITERIITGNAADEVVRIALRHHEKLNGTGYPARLTAANLSLPERIMAIADIFSALCGARSYKGAYPREKIIEILNDMSQCGFIDAKIVSLTSENFDSIMEKLYEESNPVIEMYDIISKEYAELIEKVKSIKARAGFEGLLVQ